MDRILVNQNKFNIYLNGDEQEIENENKKYLREANFSSINPIDNSVERNAIKKLAIDGVLSNRKIVEDYNTDDRRKKNMSTVAKVHNNDLNLSFADNSNKSNRMSPNHNCTRDNLSFNDDNSSIIYQNSTIGSIYSGSNHKKNLSVWDAMCLHDVKNYQKEEQIKKFVYRDRQRQLKDFLDKQVNDHRNKANIEKNKDMSEYQYMLNKINQFDQVQNK